MILAGQAHARALQLLLHPGPLFLVEVGGRTRLILFHRVLPLQHGVADASLVKVYVAQVVVNRRVARELLQRAP